MMEVEKSNVGGIANAGLTTGIIGTALGALNSGILPGLFGGNCNTGCNTCGDHYVSRYDAGKDARIAELETEVKLRDANFYTVSQIDKLRNYVDGRFDGVNAAINQQAVINAQVAANLSCLQGTVNTLSGLSKTVIPISSICPEPMARFNSWTAPTTETTTGA